MTLLNTQGDGVKATVQSGRSSLSAPSVSPRIGHLRLLHAQALPAQFTGSCTHILSSTHGDLKVRILADVLTRAKRTYGFVAPLVAVEPLAQVIAEGDGGAHPDFRDAVDVIVVPGQGIKVFHGGGSVPLTLAVGTGNTDCTAGSATRACGRTVVVDCGADAAGADGHGSVCDGGDCAEAQGDQDGAEAEPAGVHHDSNEHHFDYDGSFPAIQGESGGDEVYDTRPSLQVGKGSQFVELTKS